MILEKVYDELISQIEDLKKAIAGGSGGTNNYDGLSNRPKVNNITLTGNKKSSDLKIAYSMTEAEYAAATKNSESIYCLQENATTLTDSAYVNLEVADWTEVSGVYKQTKPFVFEVTPAAGWTIEDVSIETGIASIDSYEVTEDPFGLSITYAAETLPKYGITATVTVTINQPAGSTRIVKNGIGFGDGNIEVKKIDAGTGTTSRSFTFSKKPKLIFAYWSNSTDGYTGNFQIVYGENRATWAGKVGGIGIGDAGVSTLEYSEDGLTMTITAQYAWGAMNSGASSEGSMVIIY